MLSIVVCIVSAKAYVQHNPSYYHGYDDEHDDHYEHPYTNHKQYNEHIEAHDYHVSHFQPLPPVVPLANSITLFGFISARNRTQSTTNTAMALKMHTPAITNKHGKPATETKLRVNIGYMNRMVPSASLIIRPIHTMASVPLFGERVMHIIHLSSTMAMIIIISSVIIIVWLRHILFWSKYCESLYRNK